MNNVKFRHIYIPNFNPGSTTHPVATLAGVETDSNDCIRFALARCNSKDQFIKEVGRKISFGRLARCKNLTKATEDFDVRVHSLLDGECASFMAGEIPDLIEAIKLACYQRYGLSYREFKEVSNTENGGLHDAMQDLHEGLMSMS